MFSFARAKAFHLRIGRRGENIACRFLKNRRMDILLRNYRCKAGEIDIIARDGAVICFVEVKTRRKESKARPAEGLSEKQKARIYKAAMHYLKELGNPPVVYHFDLIEIILSRFDISELRYWTSHFTKPEHKKLY